MKRADCSLGVAGILSCVAPLAFQMPVVVFKRFQNIRTGLLIGNAGGNVLSRLRILDVDLFFLIRLFLAHDGFDDCRRELALFGKCTQLDGLRMRWRCKRKANCCGEILLFQLAQIAELDGWSQSDTAFIYHSKEGWDEFCETDIKAALIHYQFETIHPFLDGNGRVGRLLITLFLMGVNELSSPVLYLSCFLKLNRIEYYDRMSEVRKAGNYEQWVKFFLRGIAETAEDATETIDRLNALHQKNEAKLADVPTRSRHNIMRLLAYIEQNPIIETVKTASALGLSRNGTANYITMLCNRNILKYSAKSGKALVFAYEEYLDILRKDT